MSLIYQWDIGAKIVTKTGNLTLDLTSGTFTMMVEKESGATAEWSVTEDFSTGYMTHITEAGDLDEEGEYKVQIKAEIGTDVQVSDANSFYVYKKIY